MVRARSVPDRMEAVVKHGSGRRRSALPRDDGWEDSLTSQGSDPWPDVAGQLNGDSPATF